MQTREQIDYVPRMYDPSFEFVGPILFFAWACRPFRETTTVFLVASGDYPTCLRQASLLNPGLRHVVPIRQAQGTLSKNEGC